MLALSLTLGAAACTQQDDDLMPIQISKPAPTPTPLPPSATADDLFDPSKLHDIYLTVQASDLAQLRERVHENTFYAADLTWESTVVRNVAIRARGANSRDPNKLGIYIDVDRHTRGQRFLGLRTLVLDNLVQDPSMMREVLAMAIFAKMGQPAPRAAACRVYFNHEYEGLFAVIENLDSVFIDWTFGSDEGYLFEYQMQERFDGDDLGGDLAIYKAMFEARTNGTESDAILYEPIRALFEAVNAPEDVKTRADVDARVNLEQFVRLLAIEKTMTEFDGLAGLWGMNNFYLYRDAGSDRHSFIPWDRDRSLVPELLGASIFDRVYENAVARRALSYDDLFTLYLDVAEDTARALADNEWLSSEVERVWSLIQPAAYADTRKPYPNLDVDDAMSWLRQIAVERPSRVLAEVGARRAAAWGVR